MITIRRLRFELIFIVLFFLASCSRSSATPVQLKNTLSPSSPTQTSPIQSPTTTTTPAGVMAEKQVVDPLDNQLTQEGIQGWAILVAKEDYSDTGDVSLETGFLNMYQLRSLLDYYGWEEDHILEIRDNFGANEIRESLDWLETVADQDDVVLFYIQGHSSYLREGLNWQSFFADEWEDILSQRRVLVVEACHAAEFTEVTSSDPNSQLTVASVAANEIGWAGLWEEGMPIIGGVFSHYFLAAFTDPSADLDGNGFVSIQESAYAADKYQREYMHEIIFTVPEFIEQYHAVGIYPSRDQDFPHVIVKDNLAEPVYLDLDVYQHDK